MLNRGLDDPLYADARQLVIDRSHPSAAFLQRHYTIGYNRASALIEALEADGVVTTDKTTGKRTVNATPAANLPEPVREALELIGNVVREYGSTKSVDAMNTVEEAFAAITQQAEERARDASRYRFLRDTADNRTGHPFIARRTAFGVSAWSREHADNAVDAAMQEPQP